MRTLVTLVEPRILLYSFTLTDGVLRLYTDNVSEYLSVTLENDNVKATLLAGTTQVAQQQWSNSSVKQMLINLFDGDDRLKITPKLKQPVLATGGNGNDTLTTGGGKDSISGGAGNDVLDGGANSDTMLGNGGNDTVDYSSRTGNLVIDLENRNVRDGEVGENDDIQNDIRIVLCGSGNDVVHGTTVSDFIMGNDGNDTIYGGAGDDGIYGGGGEDLIYGEAGRDKIYGDTANDRIFGGSGNDTIKGGKGRDRIYGQDGNDKLYDNDNAIDIIDGGAGTDGIDKDSDDVVYNIP